MTTHRTGRRGFLGGLLAAGIVPKPSWADAGAPRYLSAAALSDGRYVLCGIRADLDLAFQLPLPERGHAAAAHPARPEAVAFARRPGTFALVIDCALGMRIATLTAPEGRHFYGHGAFSADGTRLFTTENDYEAGEGRIGIWDAEKGYRRIGEWASGGIGPHEIRRLPGSDVLVVANGGIDTHPDSGRAKLNIPTMRPNLSYISDGAIVETVELDAALHKNSIRHLDVSRSGQVAIGMQWQGDRDPSALVATHERGASIRLLEAPEDRVRAMNGYVGSIAFSEDGTRIAATSPRGGQVQIFDARDGRFASAQSIADACGIARGGAGFTATSGTGAVARIGSGPGAAAHDGLRWDNHLVSLS
ncbi:DUF1513 domain-containing protein [Marivita sp. GX14005]|uniref:DUF1513 domain-containing protein n=1 Tax=Marivita sp. GX14005 TaxID=2942276 RepID=UPI0020188ED6|nr:DUF1513 domain-containing protein [Marivita sp. GX14005]MCL3883156.1 DUF1513 domain-containing protein [Marivita sp. GX14005]